MPGKQKKNTSDKSGKPSKDKNVSMQIFFTIVMPEFQTRISSLTLQKLTTLTAIPKFVSKNQNAFTDRTH